MGDATVVNCAVGRLENGSIVDCIEAEMVPVPERLESISAKVVVADDTS